MKIDSHQHFWNYDPVDYRWIDENMAVLKMNYLPPQLEKLLRNNSLDGCVAIQARQTERETKFLLQLAEKYNFIKGVVGWVDLCNSDVRDRLAYFAKSKKLCGIRHILQSEPDDKFMLQENFQKGIYALNEFDLVYDILIFPKHLEPVYYLVQNFPNQRFIIDHLAKPHIKDGKIKEWKVGIERLSQFPNVSCKFSGLVTEASWDCWESDEFIPYLDIVFSCFGVDRIMFGSDWPVCLLCSNYDQVISIVTKYISDLEKEDQQKVMGLNAAKFYNLN